MKMKGTLKQEKNVKEAKLPNPSIYLGNLFEKTACLTPNGG